MSIDSLTAINPLLPSATELPALQPIGVGNHISFGEMLISGAMKADANLKIADQAMQAFALGGDIPPHQVMLALERSPHVPALRIASAFAPGRGLPGTDAYAA